MQRQIKEYTKKMRECEKRLDMVVEEMFRIEAIPSSEMTEEICKQYWRLDMEREGWIFARNYWSDEIAHAKGYEDWNDYMCYCWQIWDDLRAEYVHIR